MQGLLRGYEAPEGKLLQTVPHPIPAPSGGSGSDQAGLPTRSREESGAMA
jgi:hypothetical protein